MKSKLFLMLSLVINLQTFAQYTLTIEVNHLRNNHGKVLLSLYDVNQVEIKGLKGAIVDSKSIFKIDSLKPGRYAFKYFHDENDNSLIETNSMGIPEEGYGFSNNARGLFGPPNFSKWVFELSNDKTIQCIPKYL